MKLLQCSRKIFYGHRVKLSANKIRNNDSTIRVFSLSQSCVLDTIKFPTAMNHASISPDGKLLVAVGDEPQVFFCRRFVLPIVQAEGEVTFAKYEWHLIAEPKLSLAYSHDACFSTAFSPSGHICAVASEAGVITVFDTSLIRDDMERDEAVIGVFKSSRPYIGGNKAGAVRSMSFAPAPWDLLAWAEDQGRVCVVDLRNAFHSRQTIELETNSPGLDRANLLDIEDRSSTSEQRQLEIEARFVQRHREALDAQDHLAAVSHAADYMEFAAERRRIERGARELRPAALREEFMQLTDSERHMLDSIRINRLQENNHSRPDAAQQNSLSLRSSSVGSSERQADNQTTSDPPTPSNIPQNTAQTSRVTSSMREYMRQRDSERTERNHASDRSYQPHRRSSVVISNGNVTSDSSSSHPSSLALIGTATPTLSASPSHLTSPSETTVSLFTSGDPWQTIVEAASPGTGTSIADAASRIRRDRENTVGRSWDRRIQQQQQPAARFERVRNPTANMARLRQLHGMTIGRAVTAEGLYDDNELEMLRRLQETRVRREEGVGTMGIGWSQDGRNL